MQKIYYYNIYYYEQIKFEISLISEIFCLHI